MISRALALAFFISAPFLALFAEEKGPLDLDVPDGWTLTYKGGKTDFYTLQNMSDPMAPQLLMFSEFPAPMGPDMIPMLVEQMSQQFIAMAKDQEAFSIVEGSKETFQIKGEKLNGSGFSVKIQAGPTQADLEGLQTMFLVSLDDSLWNGQYTGTAEGWKGALKIIEGIKLQKEASVNEDASPAKP